ncbi:nucleophosmin 1b isoform X2 [Trichomycterus rosablanca]|uniref:nucleophosmin 1b isoform X2 n=1 Tax=Trichomycterus rosablanca TaxID=2290929 RepID=UPI002F35CD00
MAEANVSEVKRPNMFLFGCTLDTCKKVHRIHIDDDEADHQLSLKTVCLGAEAEDTFHTVEIEGVMYDGRMTKIPLAVLKPSVLPSLSLGGFEVTPPFTFRLLSGTGPVYISGQHFTSFKECTYQVEEENNTSPVKRPSSMALGKVPQKKLKMDSDDDEEEEEEEEGDSEDYEEDDSDDQDEDEKIDVAKTSFTFQQKAPEKKKSADKQNSSPGKKDDRAGKPQSQVVVKGNDRTGPGASGKTSGKTPGKTPSINEVKSRLATAAKEGKSLPKTEQKFENYAKSSFKITDKQVIKDLWNFVQTLKK